MAEAIGSPEGVTPGVELNADGGTGTSSVIRVTGDQLHGIPVGETVALIMPMRATDDK